MGLNFNLIDGQTPLEEEEKEGLLISSITTLQDLNEFEQQGIEDAIRWTLRKKYKSTEILSEAFVKLVHRKMFGEVWAWAGEFRKTNKNIGMDWYHVPVALQSLLTDCIYWIKHDTYPADEIAIRFKHRIVQIHCFANGNGRHSRLMGDILIEHVFKRPVFSWGSKTNLAKTGKGREEYLQAVKTADIGDMLPLIKFSRS